MHARCAVSLSRIAPTDAQQRKISPLPYLLATLALGSAGPLLYLVRRFADRLVGQGNPRLGFFGLSLDRVAEATAAI